MLSARRGSTKCHVRTLQHAAFARFPVQRLQTQRHRLYLPRLNLQADALCTGRWMRTDKCESVWLASHVVKSRTAPPTNGSTRTALQQRGFIGQSSFSPMMCHAPHSAGFISANPWFQARSMSVLQSLHVMNRAAMHKPSIHRRSTATQEQPCSNQNSACNL